MKYFLVEERNTLYIEVEKWVCYKVKKGKKKLENAGFELYDLRVGFDESEPEDSPYRFGNISCMPDIVEVTKEEAEKYAGTKFNWE